MGKKKQKRKEVTVKATPAEYREAALVGAQLALWACAAFSLEETADNARAMYRLAISRAGDYIQAEQFIAGIEGDD